MNKKPIIIANFFDCDETLVRGYVPEILITHYGVDPQQFWAENVQFRAEERAKKVNVDDETSYLNLILKYVREGKFPGLSNAKLGELGSEVGRTVEMFKGLPEFFGRTKHLVKDNPKYSQYGITVEHYIITTGLKEMVVGSPLNCADITDIFGAEFYEERDIVAGIGRTVGAMQKTKFLHDVNKGVNFNPNIDVHKRMPRDQRRVQFENMSFTGDGFTDVPGFATIGDRSGFPYIVYDLLSEDARSRASSLVADGRAASASPADFSPGSVYSNRFEQGLIAKAERVVWECLNR